MKQKSSIRREILYKRDQLTAKEVGFLSKKISENLITKFFSKLPNLEEKLIASYISSRNEVDTKTINNYLFDKTTQILLPKIRKDSNEMDFVIFQKNDELENNEKYKRILEPKQRILAKENPDIILLPLVSCDKNGNRIGMGKGFYDKKISQIKENNQNITLIGLAYNFQIVTKIKHDNNDQTIDFIASETNLFDYT